MLPLAVDLQGCSVLVVGAGAVGAHKAAVLVGEGARVTVIAAELLAPLPEGLAKLEVRRYQPGDTVGHHLVVAATGDPVVDDLLVAETNEHGTWLNVVDDPARSSFFFTALHRAGDVIVSVSTSGASPALAQVLRDRLAAQLDDNVAEVAEQLRAERAERHEAGESTEGIDWRPHVNALLDAPR